MKTNDMLPIRISGKSLSVDTLATIANGAKIELTDEAIIAIQAARTMLDEWIEDERVLYGITTGFGPLVNRIIPTKYQSELQQNLIRSHSANVGPLFDSSEVRAAMVLRLNAIAKGCSGLRVETALLLQHMLNAGVHPEVPQWGSVGASGDLTPSSHIALAMMGEGNVEYKGKHMPAKKALAKAGLKPVVLEAKEGLGMINGTTMMTGVGGLTLGTAWNMVKTAEVISAMGIEVLLGSVEPFHAKGHEVKPHPGQIQTAKNLRTLLESSNLVMKHIDLKSVQEKLRSDLKEMGDVVHSGISVQNVYSMRATPQVLGAVRDALTYVTTHVEIEMNSVNDNPLFFVDEQMAYQGANFHGQPVALPFDVLSIALTQMGIISERRLNKILDESRSGGLPPFLARNKAGLRCGFEGAQYIPTSLIAECRTLCNPASIQSIPSNAENQDVVSMGLVAARKARDIGEKISFVLAVELLAIVEAAELRGVDQMSEIGQAVYKHIRTGVKNFSEDRVMSADITTVREMIVNGTILELATSIVGEL